MTVPEFNIYIISDSVGETAQRIIHATLAQFPSLKETTIKRYPFIDDFNELKEILFDAKREEAVVVTTIVNQEMNQYINKFALENNVKHIDYMSDLIQLVSNQTGLQPSYQSGAIHELDQEYFDRVAAIEFAVKYDDGKSASGLLKADIVVLGVSRTSKTPLSMYLANKSFKVANLPLIPEVSLPDELFKINNHRIIGLTASPEYILNIRSERIKMMGLDTASRYSDLERIRRELSYAEELYSKLNAHVINVENKSIEETAQIIEQVYRHNEVKHY